MFTISTVDDCPATRGSRGVMKFSPELIGDIAGLVRDRIEWILLLTGERSDDGFTVNVTGFDVPPQYRSYGDAEIVDDVELPANLVGVMHSHHTMGAFFSNIDTSTLNPRFPSSIVVARSDQNNLGFKYKAVGKVVLPCGSVGEVEFRLSIDGVSHYTFEVVQGVDQPHDLGDCNNSVDTNSEYFSERRAACGLVDTVERNSVFGQAGGAVLTQIEAATHVKAKVYNGGKGGSYGGGYFSDRYYSGNGSYHDNRIGFAPTERKQLTDGGAGKKKKRRGGKKWSARKNGLVKLERPGGGSTVQGTGFDDAANGSYLQAGCNECGRSGLLQYHHIMEEWLCWQCKEETNKLIEACSDDDAVEVMEGHTTLVSL